MENKSTLKVLSFLILLCGSFISIKSQSVVATYTEKMKMENMPQESDPRIQELIKNAGTHTKELTVSAGVSLYTEKQKELEEAPAHRVVIQIGEDDRATVYKNLAQKQLIKQQEFLGRAFIIREKLKPISWKIESEQKTIGSYNCKKATATIDSFNVVAWFCPDIAVNDGPDIFWGLPGLILEVDVNNGMKTIYINSVKIANEVAVVEVPQRGKEITQQEYNKIKKDKMDEMKKMHSSGEPDKVEIRVVR